MTDVEHRPAASTRIGRYRFMDAQAVNLDGFAVEDPRLGLVAFDSPDDPRPSLVVEGGRVVELDGRREDEFDVLVGGPAADPDPAHHAAAGPQRQAAAVADVALNRRPSSRPPARSP